VGDPREAEPAHRAGSKRDWIDTLNRDNGVESGLNGLGCVAVESGGGEGMSQRSRRQASEGMKARRASALLGVNAFDGVRTLRRSKALKSESTLV
jgi:hypothetical protein